MKALLVVAMVPAVMLRMCGDESEEVDEPPAVDSVPAAVEVDIEANAEVAQPRHDGTVVVAQDHAVEVVTYPNEVRAYVVDVHGEPPPPAQTSLLVNVNTHTHPHPVALSWNAELGYYSAPLVHVEPVPGPMNVVLLVEGRPRYGYVRTYAVAPSAVVHVDTPRPHVDVHVGAPPPPRANVDVHLHAPRPPSAHFDVHIGAPPPPSARVDVRVGAPQPRVRVRSVRGKFKHRKHRHRGMGMHRARVRIR